MITGVRTLLALSLGLVLFATPCLAQMLLETEEVLAVATKSLDEDLATLEKAYLEGTLVWESLDPDKEIALYSKFACYLDEGQMRHDSVVDLHKTTYLPGHYDEVHSLLLEGESLYVTRFSQRIYPTGSETRIHRHKPNQEVFGATQGTMWWLPTDLVCLAFNPTHVLAKQYQFETLPGGLIQGEWTREASGLRSLVTLDPKLGYRSVSLQVYRDRKLIEHVAIEWKQHDGIWMISSVDNTSDQKRIRIRWKLEKFELPKAIDPAKFTEADLGAFPGSRVIDERR